MKGFEQVHKPLLPSLWSDRLLVRPLREQDAKPIFDYRSLPDGSNISRGVQSPSIVLKNNR
ncbi:MAG: hypothetical protein WBF19_04545, partial [Candidatus Cybelea sp.]